jgi:secreted Zn-dependent insulinase-like peptidase
VSAGTSSQNIESNSMFSAFTVSISLTVKGLATWTAVAEKVFEYIAMLRRAGPQRWIHDEIQRVSEIDYHYADEEVRAPSPPSLPTSLHARDSSPSPSSLVAR